ncbi:MAG TPA: TIGR00266 family protein [Polyangiaceae bacterium]|nr:TIGR00266 family protein [Polyangiaceae bacterium]
MQLEILYRPAHTLARVHLAPGEAVLAEAGAMVGMSTNVQLQTQSGGLGKGLLRMFGGESFFRNTFTAQGAPGEVLLAQPLCGDMVALEMSQYGFFITSASFVASTPNVEINTKVSGLRGFFSGEGMFVLQATAPSPGQVLLGAFGGIQEIYCDNNLVIDTGHLVAWDATLEYKVGKSAAGWIGSFLSGEGLVCHFSGQGRIWIQSRNPAEYGHNVGAMLPPRK